MKSVPFKLYTIADCNLFNHAVESKLKVPNIQRGLVWKSNQIELLWDSILREFPIGSMLAMKVKQDEDQYELLDGQQRSNAIITGFSTYALLNDKQPPSSILWLDLNFKPLESDPEDRRFGIRLSNQSHPWGFSVDGGKLSARERRKALLDAYGDKEKIPTDKSTWDVRKFVPYLFCNIQTSTLPVPLAFFVNAAKGKSISSSDDINTFWDEVKKSIDTFSKYSELWERQYKESVFSFIEAHKNDSSFLNTFFKLNDYEVLFNYVEPNEDIEVLFNRINRLGTRMTDAELAYAAIKHYGSDLCNCNNIGEKIKSYADGLMLEQNLAQIIFWYCFSTNKIKPAIGGDKIGVDARTVRKYKVLWDRNKANDEDNIIIDCLRKAFSDEDKEQSIKTLLKDAKDILLASPDETPLPSFLFAEIADSKPVLILLLFRLIEKHKNCLESDSPGFIQALIFYLYCFCVNPKPIYLIYEAASDSKFSKNVIQNILRDSISREWCYSLVPSFKDFEALKDEEISTKWQLNSFSDRKGYAVFSVLFPYKTYQGLFMLKYAQRKYYQKYFGDYNPCKKDLWEEINRPWDHDHIVPQNWISEGDWKTVHSIWINSMGNIADIPFEQNRGKGDADNWEYYDMVESESAGENLLFFDERIKKLDSKALIKGLTIDIRQFIALTRERFIKISDEFLSVFQRLGIEDGLSPLQQERKDYLTLMKKSFTNTYNVFYKGLTNKEYRIDDNSNYYWQRPWISLMAEDGGIWRHAVSVYIIRENNMFQIERGNRKSPDLDLTSTQNLFWEKGTQSTRFVSQLLDRDKKITEYVKLFVSGGDIFNKETGLSGFVSDASAFIAYNGSIQGVDIHAHIYDWHSYEYCIIKAQKEGADLPDVILNNFSDFEYRHCNYIEKKFKLKSDMPEYCKQFVEIIKKLVEIDQQCHQSGAKMQSGE